jgi:hypothetical protein
MSVSKKSLRLQIVIGVVVVAILGGMLVMGTIAVRHAQHAAARCTALGRLCQMRLALQNYERAYGTLPPICLKDRQGTPIQSWRALLVPYLEVESLKDLDLSESWQSARNRAVIAKTPARDWIWFCRDRMETEPHLPVTHIVALLGADSIWDAETGLPKTTLFKKPHAVLLLSIPASDIHPLEPRDLTEAELRTRIEKGEEILFINSASYSYGDVRIENGRLVFLPNRENQGSD